MCIYTCHEGLAFLAVSYKGSPMIAFTGRYNGVCIVVAHKGVAARGSFSPSSLYILGLLLATQRATVREFLKMRSSS